MALTGTETFGTVVPGFVTNLAGSLAVTSVTAGTGYGIVPGFITDADGRLLVSTDTTGAAWVGGFIRNSNGALVITSSAPTDFGTIVPGFNTNSSGHLAMSSATGAVWVTGFLQNTNKSLALAGYGAYVNLLSPSILLSLAGSTPLTDLSGNARNGTAAGGVTGGAWPLGPITGAPTPRRNLCDNPSFETNTTNWGGVVSTIARTTDQAYAGTYSLANTATGAGSSPVFNLEEATGLMVPATEYTFSVYVKPVQSGRNMRLQLVFRNAFANVNVVNGTDTNSVPTGEWTRLEVTGTSGALVDNALCYIQVDRGAAGTAGDITYIDGAMMEAASSAGTYFPTTAQLASGEAGWYGTANASDSYSIGTPYVPNDTGATDFDGTDDRITTTYGTRRNLCTNPSFANDASGWTKEIPATTITRVAVPGVSGSGYSLEVNVAATGGGGVYINTPVAANPSADFTVAPYLKAKAAGDVGKTVRVGLLQYNGASALISTQYVAHVLTAEWAQVAHTRTTEATCATARLAMRAPAANPATDYYMTDVLHEQTGTLGTYFDGTGYIDESGNWISDPGGHVGWLGTAHASASDKGCFANGTTRTFCGWIHIDALGSGNRVVFGAAGTAVYDIPLRHGATGTAEVFIGTTQYVFTGTPLSAAAGSWVHAVVVVDEPADTVSLYLDGSLIETLTGKTAQWRSGLYPAFNSMALGNYGSQYFNGKMAWVSVHERALTADEILAAYQAR